LEPLVSYHYYELKKSNLEYIKTIESLFSVHNLSDNNISKYKSFDYMKALKEKNASRKGQLRPQLEQITHQYLEKK
jgi:hypothetical protein